VTSRSRTGLARLFAADTVACLFRLLADDDDDAEEEGKNDAKAPAAAATTIATAATAAAAAADKEKLQLIAAQLLSNVAVLSTASLLQHLVTDEGAHKERKTPSMYSQLLAYLTRASGDGDSSSSATRFETQYFVARIMLIVSSTPQSRAALMTANERTCCVLIRFVLRETSQLFELATTTAQQSDVFVARRRALTQVIKVLFGAVQGDASSVAVLGKSSPQLAALYVELRQRCMDVVAYGAAGGPIAPTHHPCFPKASAAFLQQVLDEWDGGDSDEDDDDDDDDEPEESGEAMTLTDMLAASSIKKMKKQKKKKTTTEAEDGAAQSEAKRHADAKKNNESHAERTARRQRQTQPLRTFFCVFFLFVPILAACCCSHTHTHETHTYNRFAVLARCTGNWRKPGAICAAAKLRVACNSVRVRAGAGTVGQAGHGAAAPPGVPHAAA
jgi:hypothetical protein